MTGLCKKVAATLALAPLLLAGCSSGYSVEDRAEGERAPVTAPCDALDPGRCLLPWPSSTFTTADAETETGLHLSVDTASLNARDDASSLELADGFSRVTPLLASFPRPIDETTLEAGIRLVVAQHDHPERGREIPLRVETLELPDGETLLLADPLEVLAPGADHVVVITDALRAADGEPWEVPRAVQLALDETGPKSDLEAARVGYHAPTRTLLAELDIAHESVVRVWDFTTRSAEDAREPLRRVRESCLAAVEDGSVSVEIDEVESSDVPEIEAIVWGRLAGLPSFLLEDGTLATDDAGLPEQVGTAAAPFRILLPAGEGDYRFVMYGHGTGGSEHDSAFDEQLGTLGVAKVNVRLYGWTGDDVLTTFTGLQQATSGSYGAASQLVEALGHAAAIHRAMRGSLGDALAAETLGGAPNPAAGRLPIDPVPMWVGGSLGGTTGLVYAAADPEVEHAVLNVPGAAWGQWVWHSATFKIIKGLVSGRYDDDIELALALTIGQTNLDLADGAVWKDVLDEQPNAFLIQESMGDPVLVNQGNEMVAITAGARHVGAVLEPIPGVEPADEVIEGSGITQFVTPETDDLKVHGFAARDTPAGVAAREQIDEFLRTAWDGEARIAPPPSCPGGNCDFGG